MTLIPFFWSVGQLACLWFAKESKTSLERIPQREINPDECVAMGAAITAAIESAIRKDEAPPVTLKLMMLHLIIRSCGTQRGKTLQCANHS